VVGRQASEIQGGLRKRRVPNRSRSKVGTADWCRRGSNGHVDMSVTICHKDTDTSIARVNLNKIVTEH
jgi:hypothetical protein